MTQRNLKLVIACFLTALIVLSACSDHSQTNSSSAKEVDPLFTLLPPDRTNIHFSNTITEGLNTNVLMYEYFYNGGGVAVGDLNGDGLQDIYFSANMVGNKLYLNKGNMQFQDITNEAGVTGRNGPWKTGVTMADVNGDGKLDIYLCYSGKIPGLKRVKQLFINEGADANNIPKFSDQAQRYGLADSAYSTQAVFFDYDRDNDLDLFLLNHSPIPLPVLDEAVTADIMKKVDRMNGPRLLQNDKGYFNDVTEKTGITSSTLSYGLGAGIADIDKDGWPDIYISNDYAVPDYLYMNNGDGTFTNEISEQLGQITHFSMGNDVSDVNNDALPDVYTLDMLPEDNRRQKLLFAPDNYEKFDLHVRSGFHYQYMRNMLHVNNGNGTFSEIGQLAGISNTDWSWAPLFADYDNDGWKDLYVTNGYLRDFTNMDFIKYMGGALKDKKVMRKDLLDLVHKMPASDVKNYMYRNNGDLTFSDNTVSWGFDIAANSNGAVYADLDNDGDLDLIVNNINKPAFIYQNEANNKLKNHYIAVKLEGDGANKFGIGAKLTLRSKGRVQYQEQMPARGYQSSVSPVLHFGLGAQLVIDTIEIVWQSGKQEIITGVKADQQLIIQEKNAQSQFQPQQLQAPIFSSVANSFEFEDASYPINDFKRQPLLITPLSFSGPCLIKGDINKDGLEDIFVGGGGGQSAQLFIQQKNGSFIRQNQIAFDADKQSEDTDALFFDANGDGHTDLYVTSGGYHNYTPDDPLLQDRLYINDSRGNLIKKSNALPSMLSSKSCVAAADINGDGSTDLFVGGRVIPGRYPETPQSFVLINDGKGNFRDLTGEVSPELQRVGMVADAVWTDLNGDQSPELIVAGEWMPVSIFEIAQGKLVNKTTSYLDKNYSGWWNTIFTGDFNKDGKTDLIVGNYGLNGQCKVSDKEPAEMLYKDFDDNGSVDPIFSFYIQGKSYPYISRDELLDQMSIMRTRFIDYKSYADATIKDLFTDEEMQGAKHLSINYLKTAYFESGKDGKLHEKQLPLEAQVSPVYAITSLDYNSDGVEDLLFAGNINHPRLRFGKSDANFGILLRGEANGEFTYVPQLQSGFDVRGDTRSILNINGTLLFGVNQKKMQAYKVNAVQGRLASK